MRKGVGYPLKMREWGKVLNDCAKTNEGSNLSADRQWPHVSARKYKIFWVYAGMLMDQNNIDIRRMA